MPTVAARDPPALRLPHPRQTTDPETGLLPNASRLNNAGGHPNKSRGPPRREIKPPVAPGSTPVTNPLAPMPPSSNPPKEPSKPTEPEPLDSHVLLREEFKDVDVVTLYLLPEVNLRLKPVLQKGLKPGARVVSHDFDMGDDWKEDKKEEVKSERSYPHTIYLWTIKEKKKEK